MHSPSHLVEIYLQIFQCHSAVKCTIIYSENVVSTQIPEKWMSIINEPQYLVQLNYQTNDKQLRLWLARVISKKWIPKTEVLINIYPEVRHEGCLWINTDDCGIFLTYFMIIFLTDLDKNENTYVYLNVIRIKQDFRCLFYHDSIIKMFCSTEQNTSHVHAHTFFELKKQWQLQNCELLIRFWEIFLWCPKWSLLCFLWFLCSVVLTIFGFDYSVGRSMLSCYHAQRQTTFSDTNCFSQELLQPNFIMCCIIGQIWNEQESDRQNSLHEDLNEILSQEVIKEGQTDPPKISADHRMTAIVDDEEIQKRKRHL